MSGAESDGIQGKICRLCLSDAGVILPIFDGEVAERFSVPLPMKILACVSIEVSNVIRYANNYTAVKRAFEFYPVKCFSALTCRTLIPQLRPVK